MSMANNWLGMVLFLWEYLNECILADHTSSQWVSGEEWGGKVDSSKGHSNIPC